MGTAGEPIFTGSAPADSMTPRQPIPVSVVQRVTMRIRFLSAGILFLSACASLGGISEVLDFYDWLEVRRQEFNSAIANQDVAVIQSLRRRLARTVSEFQTELLRDVEAIKLDRRQLAIFGLGYLPSLQARDKMLSLLEDENPLIRQSAAASLGLQGLKSTPLGPLASLLDDEDERVRLGALFGLWQLVEPGEDRGTLSAVLKRLDDLSPAVRSEAIIVLRRMALPSTLAPLVEKGLKDSFAIARMNAAAAVGVIGADEYDPVPGLIEALRDTDRMVVLSAWHALRKVTGKNMDRAYHTWRDWFEEEERLYEYACPKHSAVRRGRPGKCSECSTVLDRTLKVPAARGSESANEGDFACPKHPDVRATQPMICLRCGERLVTQKTDKKDSEEEGK